MAGTPTIRWPEMSPAQQERLDQRLAAGAGTSGPGSIGGLSGVALSLGSELSPPSMGGRDGVFGLSSLGSAGLSFDGSMDDGEEILSPISSPLAVRGGDAMGPPSVEDLQAMADAAQPAQPRLGEVMVYDDGAAAMGTSYDGEPFVMDDDEAPVPPPPAPS